MEIDLLGLKTALDSSGANRLADIFGVLDDPSDVNSDFFDWQVHVFGQIFLDYVDNTNTPHLYFNTGELVLPYTK